MAHMDLHPAIDHGLAKGVGGFAGGTLFCKCPSEKVAVEITGDVAHNHACGCSKCWKPEGALFSVVGVVPVGKLRVTAHEEKLHVVDEAAAIQRHACEVCGTHMYGRIVRDHPFKGLDFVHVELSEAKGWQEPQFAAFVSSIIEQGFEPSGMGAVREKFKSVGLVTYDCLAPPLMDAIAAFTAAKAGTAYKAPVAPVAAAPTTPPPAEPVAKPAAPSERPALSTAQPQAAASAAPAIPPVKKPGGVAGFFARLFGG